MNPSHNDTIVALATPVGRSAVSLLRLSGSQAQSLIKRFFRPVNWVPRRACVGNFETAQGEVLDQVLVTWFQAPSSYTGEDLCEIGCHGSPAVVESILGEILGAGARLARPGEFTMRAFLNGRIDLLQAEAVRDLIESNTRFQARVAAEQIGGRLSRLLDPLKEELIRIASHLETHLEFVEDEVEPEVRERLCQALGEVASQLDHLSKSFQLGRLLREGCQVSICGRPNVGKSSIFNALLTEERAIVTSHPGTTRDAVGELCEIAGFSVRLVDTAGIRTTNDPVERLGVERSHSEIETSDLVLFVLDGSESFGLLDEAVWEGLRGRPVQLVRNKSDLERRLEIPSEMERDAGKEVAVSALVGTGLAELRQCLGERLLDGLESFLDLESGMVTNVRQKGCVDEALNHLVRSERALTEGLSEEFVLYDLRKALDSLGELTGEITVDDILEKIFSSFCIGK